MVTSQIWWLIMVDHHFFLWKICGFGAIPIFRHTQRSYCWWYPHVRVKYLHKFLELPLFSDGSKACTHAPSPENGWGSWIFPSDVHLVKGRRSRECCTTWTRETATWAPSLQIWSRQVGRIGWWSDGEHGFNQYLAHLSMHLLKWGQ